MTLDNYGINRFATGLMLLATAVLVFGGCGGKGFFEGRVKRMSGTYEGQLELSADGSTDTANLDVEIREGSSTDLLIDLDDLVLKAEITGRDTFEIVEEDHDVPAQGCGAEMEVTGDGEVVDDELRLDMEWDWPNCTANAEYEGAKL